MSYEIEKKFVLTSETAASLLEGAEFLGKKTIVDTYYDTMAYSLVRQDKWLRERDGVFELKLSLPGNGKDGIDRYQEITDGQQILWVLGVDAQGPLTRDTVISSGYLVLAPILTERRKYRKNGFMIDVDVMDFGYEVAEIEMLIDEKDGDAADAAKRIAAFAERMGLSLAPVRGKVIEYLARNNRELYVLLVKTGVVRA